MPTSVQSKPDKQLTKCYKVQVNCLHPKSVAMTAAAVKGCYRQPKPLKSTDLHFKSVLCSMSPYLYSHSR